MFEDFQAAELDRYGAVTHRGVANAAQLGFAVADYCVASATNGHNSESLENRREEVEKWLGSLKLRLEVDDRACKMNNIASFSDVDLVSDTIDAISVSHDRIYSDGFSCGFEFRITEEELLASQIRESNRQIFDRIYGSLPCILSVCDGPFGLDRFEVDFIVIDMGLKTMPAVTAAKSANWQATPSAVALARKQLADTYRAYLKRVDDRPNEAVDCFKGTRAI
jgi:hypothetical protein